MNTIKEVLTANDREMAVRVAKDVLAQVDCKQFKPWGGVYFAGGTYEKSNKDSKCKVCAVGSIWVSALEMKGKNPRKVKYEEDDKHDFFKDNLNIFSSETLRVLEAFFEGFHVFESDLKLSPEERSCYEKMLAYKHSFVDKTYKLCPDWENNAAFIYELRLRAIMQTIIDNDGLFDPEYAVNILDDVHKGMIASNAPCRD